MRWRCQATVHAGGSAVRADQVTGVSIPERGSQRAVFGGKRPTQLLWVSPGLPGQPTAAACGGRWDTAFPAVWEEASLAERTEQAGWAANPSSKAEHECQAETRSPRFGSALCQLASCTPFTYRVLPPSGPCRSGLPRTRTVGCPAGVCCSGHQLGGWAWAPGFLGSERFEGCQCFILLGMFFKKGFIHHFIKERTI